MDRLVIDHLCLPAAGFEAPEGGAGSPVVLLALPPLEFASASPSVLSAVVSSAVVSSAVVSSAVASSAVVSSAKISPSGATSTRSVASCS